DVANADMLDELGEIAARRVEGGDGAFPFRLVCRRMRELFNSNANDGVTTNGRRFNAAYLHPDDLLDLGLRAGDVVRISSHTGTVIGIAAADDALRRGLVSM